MELWFFLPREDELKINLGWDWLLELGLEL
jgi:hypothetical protein